MQVVTFVKERGCRVILINKDDAVKAVAEYLRNEDIRRHGKARLATCEYECIAEEILREGGTDGESND